MAVPNMIPVDSSSVARIGYDDANRELYVEFLEGRTYVYSPVPETTHQELMDADSKGSYFNREIRPNYDCRPL